MASTVTFAPTHRLHPGTTCPDGTSNSFPVDFVLLADGLGHWLRSPRQAAAGCSTPLGVDGRLAGEEDFRRLTPEPVWTRAADGTLRCDGAPEPLATLTEGGHLPPGPWETELLAEGARAAPPLEPWTPTRWIRQPGELPVAVQVEPGRSILAAADALRPGAEPGWTYGTTTAGLRWLGHPIPDAELLPIAPALTRADSLAGCGDWPEVARTLRAARAAGERHRSRVWATLRAAAAATQPRGWVSEGWHWEESPADMAEAIARTANGATEVLTQIAALIALDLHGVGGPGGYSGGQTRRMAWARRLGSGRWHAHDGDAWRAASESALETVRYGLRREHPDAPLALDTWSTPSATGSGVVGRLGATPHAIRSLLSAVDGPRPWDLEWMAAYPLWCLAQAEPGRVSAEDLRPWAEVLSEIAGHVRVARARYPGADCVEAAAELLARWRVSP